jgi:pimeloyl-ACP methyl ester carboxylesterase
MAAKRGRLAAGVGLIASVAALAAGGIAMGVELERRIVSKRIARGSQAAIEDFFSLRSGGPEVITPDGVVLHTEVDEGPANAVLIPGGTTPPHPPGEFTLLFVHGYGLHLDCWHFQRRYFRGRFREVFYDQRSHGRSSRSEAGLCRIPQLAEDLYQVLREVVGDAPVILIGHSMGGMAIMRLAQSHPELFGDRILGVALLCTSAGEMTEHSPIRGLPGRTFHRIAEPLLAGLNRIPELVAHGRRAGSDLGYVVTRRLAFGPEVPPSYVDFASEMLAEIPLEVVADYFPAFSEVDEFRALEILTTVPTVVVGGEDDVITPIEHTARIIDLLPKAEAIRVEKCGHLGMIEKHEIFNDALDGLIDRVRADLSQNAR